MATMYYELICFFFYDVSILARLILSMADQSDKSWMVIFRTAARVMAKWVVVSLLDNAG